MPQIHQMVGFSISVQDIPQGKQLIMSDQTTGDVYQYAMGDDAAKKVASHLLLQAAPAAGNGQVDLERVLRESKGQ